MYLIKRCRGGHRLKAQSNYEYCPNRLCEEKVDFETVYERKDYVEENLGSLNDRLPRMVWFGEIEENNPDTNRSKEKWSIDEMEFLKEFFDEYGVADWKTWREIAEEFFERSVYSIEHMLRYLVSGYDPDELFEK